MSIMQPTLQTNNHDNVASPVLVRAGRIPPLTHREATALASSELERFLALVESLESDEWEKPTVCPLWNVRQMLAHVTGAAAAFAHWSQFKRQFLPRGQRPYREAGFTMLDALNQIQVDDRATASSAQLIRELREAGPRAIGVRNRLPWLLRALRLPIPMTPFTGLIPLGYLTDLIFTRDMWMHRLDICRATGHEMTQTREHDGRITALVVRDLARILTPKLAGQAVAYELTGIAGGGFCLGENARPRASITMDVLDFHLLAAVRLPANDLPSHTKISGDEHIARLALDNTQAPY